METTQLSRLGTVDELEAVIGRANPAVLMKQVAALDEGCRAILALSSIAGFGYRDDAGRACATFVGGRAGFVRVESPKRIAFELPAGEPLPRIDGGVSLVFLVPGVGETLRFAGKVLARGDGSVVLAVEEAFVHCAMCIVRSKLWDRARPSLDGPEIPAFLAAAPFAIVSTWSADGASDTSPRGDPAGFLRALDPGTIVLPDRKGNQRADTFHNLVTCDDIAVAALVPGRDEILQLAGTATITSEPALLATLPPLGKPPQAALVIRVARARIVTSEPLRAARVWDPRRHVDPAAAPDFMAIAGRHLAQNESGGLKASALRFVGSLLARYPALTRRLIDMGYRKQAASEGHTPEKRRVHVAAIHRETPDAVTLLLEDPSGRPFHFAPGQFFTMELRIGRERVRRSYSASSVPGARQLSLTIKRVEGGRCSGHLTTKIRVGDRIDLHGPAGTFRVDVDPGATRELVLVGGGSGITPLKSIASTVLAAEPGTRVTLLYGNRRRDDVIFADALAALATEHPDRLVIRHVLQHAGEDWSGGRGVLDEATVARELDALAPSSAAHFFVCGPAPMMRATRDALIGRGVGADRIHEESFAPPTPAKLPTRAQPMTVVRAGNVLGTVNVPAGTTLLEAGRKKGLPLAYSCGAGNCGACILHLIEGEVTMAEPNCLTPEERARGGVLACVARPLTPTKVEIP